MNSAAVNELYSPKQQEVLRTHYNNDYFILINHGAVRSGKTFIDNDIFLSELRRIGRHAAQRCTRDPQYALAAASIGTLQRNILTPLTQKYGIDFKMDKYNRFSLFGTQVCCFGHDDIGNLTTVTGMTAYGAYINEAVLANNDVLKSVIDRCSADEFFNARIVMDTNPDSPVHPIKTDYIDKADGKRIIERHWQMTDNPHLSPNYIENLRASTPSGVFTDRKIRGLWVTAEGIVYEDYDESIHLVGRVPDKRQFMRYFAGVDWGYQHKGCILLLGETADGKLYLLEEHTARHQLIDYWVKKAQGIIERYGYGIPFYCDSARPDNVQEFINGGVWAQDADKAIKPGVEKVGEYFKTKKLFIYSKVVQEFRNEIYSYVWNEKTGDPIKLNDDVMDALRYAIYTDKGSG